MHKKSILQRNYCTKFAIFAEKRKKKKKTSEKLKGKTIKEEMLFE